MPAWCARPGARTGCCSTSTTRWPASRALRGAGAGGAVNDRRGWMRCCWPSRAASAPASTAPSRSSSARCSASARPIYVRHEIVHNTYVVNDLKAKGAIFIEELAEVPPGATLIFSAHGVSKAVRAEAAHRGFQVFDATCPLVTKVHVEVAKLAKEGYEFIMIGHKGHPEVEGTMGQLSEGIYLVEDVADVAACSRAEPRQAGRGDADHAERGRRGRDPGRGEAVFPARARAQEAGHLLRHPEPPGRGEGAGAGGRRGHRGRQPHQQQQQPPARTGRAAGHAGLHGRRAPTTCSRLVRGPARAWA
jgi:hypothetical protein